MTAKKKYVRKTYTERITILLTKEQKERLLQKAEKANRKPTDIVRELLNIYVGN